MILLEVKTSCVFCSCKLTVSFLQGPPGLPGFAGTPGIPVSTPDVINSKKKIKHEKETATIQFKETLKDRE